MVSGTWNVVPVEVVPPLFLMMPVAVLITLMLPMALFR